MQLVPEVTISVIARNHFKAHTIIIIMKINNYTWNFTEWWFRCQMDTYERGQNFYPVLDQNLVRSEETTLT